MNTAAALLKFSAKDLVVLHTVATKLNDLGAASTERLVKVLKLDYMTVAWALANLDDAHYTEASQLWSLN